MSMGKKAVNLTLIIAVLFLPLQIAFASPMLMHHQGEKAMIHGDMNNQIYQLAADNKLQTAHQTEQNSDSHDAGCEKGCVKCNFCHATAIQTSSNSLLVISDIKFNFSTGFAGVAIPVEIKPPRQLHG
ncbi:MAG: hypothetical protein OEY38_12180 [Gammaproteobacteria bacterium]|nr:hypothetical protein [Gammaproteobacteria bacterium]